MSSSSKSSRKVKKVTSSEKNGSIIESRTMPMNLSGPPLVSSNNIGQISTSQQMHTLEMMIGSSLPGVPGSKINFSIPNSSLQYEG